MEYENEPIKEVIKQFAPIFEGYTSEENVEKAFTAIIDCSGGIINLDVMDIMTTLRDCKQGDVLISYALPEELKEVLTAQKLVLDSRHPDAQVKSLLYQFRYNPDTPFEMVHTVGMSEFFSEIDEEVNIVWGISRDENVPLGEIEIICIAGF